MLLEEAKIKFEPLIYKKFGDIFTEQQLDTLEINKGKTGLLLELALGLSPSSNNLDFEDGELKTNKCDENGNSLETIFITMISSIIDELLRCRENFFETKIYRKIKNILYVPICKVGRPYDWYFLPAIHINLDLEEYSGLKQQLNEDFNIICSQLVNHIENSSDGFIHTANGQFIQIRSKDGKPYHPIYSNIYNKYVSNKNHAFYFKKQFIKYIQNMRVM